MSCLALFCSISSPQSPRSLLAVSLDMLFYSVLAIAAIALPAVHADYTITVINNCDEVVYAGAGETNAGFAMDSNPPSAADYEAGRVRSAQLRCGQTNSECSVAPRSIPSTMAVDLCKRAAPGPFGQRPGGSEDASGAGLAAQAKELYDIPLCT